MTTTDDDALVAIVPDSPQQLHERGELLHPAHEHAAPDLYPRMTNMSAAFLYRAVIRARTPARPEYVSFPLPRGLGNTEAVVAVAQWNMLWEAAQFRRHFFREDDLPGPMRRVAD